MRRILFLIPVRGGSKGFPGKNLRKFGGRSLLGRSVLTALEAARGCTNSIATVFVSTEDAALADEAKRYGAEVPFMRPESLASDEAKTIDVVLHALDNFQQRAQHFDAVVLLQATTPLTQGSDVLEALDLFFSESGRGPVVSVAPSSHPPQWTFEIVKGCMQPILPDLGAHQRQAAADSWTLNGAVYVAAPEQLRDDRSFIIPGKTRAYAMPRERSVDIDSELDLKFAELLAAEKQERAIRAGKTHLASVEIGGRLIGLGHRTYVIAEAGVNHNGDVETAIRLAHAAKEAGADCVKFQTFKAERVATASAPKADYQLKSTDPAESQVAMLKKLELSMEAYLQLIEACDHLGITFLSTPYAVEDIDFLESLGVPAYKVASALIVEPFLLRRLARTGKPIILSTGLATMEEVSEAVNTLKDVGNDKIVVLQCTTNYPSNVADTHLRAMNTMGEVLGTLVGYSDHTETETAMLAAVACGACIIEKHLTLDHTLPGPDHACSAEPQELKDLISQIREVELSLGWAEKKPSEAEIGNLVGMRRSIVAAHDIPKGKRLTCDDLTTKRPATGLSPRLWDKVVGSSAAADISADTILAWDMIDDEPDADDPRS